MIVNRVIKARDVIWRQVGDDVVVIKDNGLSIHILNKTAAFIWEMCDGKCGIDDIVEQLCERFEVTYEEAYRDVRQIVRKLAKLDIIKNKYRIN